MPWTPEVSQMRFKEVVHGAHPSPGMGQGQYTERPIYSGLAKHGNGGSTHRQLGKIPRVEAQRGEAHRHAARHQRREMQDAQGASTADKFIRGAFSGEFKRSVDLFGGQAKQGQFRN